ncbi:methyl-accepting chemotaxis protein [Brevibacillus agri]|uniref:methyl-accepting chemotaxis protein n=2 Tax=Brevibacillus agri TaxID=51101 RepID=UPI002E1F4E84|nr:methyl-accepting chemotaxis protein [Brevibacillus agri]MED1655210.1 methyl-accepting chemotaxis protein [Brevibacillus agri]MED1687224.1 methyl-accepting chemotaxis protein [Brevibacillus agri]MED1693271.1 methyl-accepting chemotaxis protein [Brevibacillus agri]MED1699479.1 methyl-accepting chemotaxis protein [Brevibacillus agri]
MQSSIGKRLVGSFLFMAILLGVTSGIAYWALSKVNQSYLDVLNHTVVLEGHVKNMKYYVVQRNQHIDHYLLTFDQDYLSLLQQDSEKISELLEQSAALMDSEEGKSKIDYLREWNTMFGQKVEHVIALSATDREKAKSEAVHSVIPFGNIMLDMAEEITAQLEQKVELELADNQQHVASTLLTMIAISVGAVVAAGWIGIKIARSISRPLESLTKAIEVIASGHIATEDVHTQSKDEIGQLVRGFNAMKNNLRQLVQQLQESAKRLAAYSEQLMTSAEQTSQATESITEIVQEVAVSSDQQLHQIEESVSSIHQLSARIRDFAKEAEETAALSAETAEKAVRGNEGVQWSKEQMNAIHASIQQLAEMVATLGQHSKEIEQIVEVISNIASQTNLLALNAAIEAARAGEHGAGFAVVADEIRKLAEQSTSSTRRIVSIIQNVREMTVNVGESMQAGKQEVAAGMELVQSAGDMFVEIERYVQMVSRQIEAETSSLHRLCDRVQLDVAVVQDVRNMSEKVSAGMQHVSAATEEQLASMEEIASSAKQLSSLADELQAAVGKFRL